MRITKNQLRTIVKEELARTMIIREGRQYRKTHGRIDEGLMTDLAKKYGLQKKAIAAILAASVAAGAFAPATAAAQDLVQGGPDIEQSADAPSQSAAKVYYLEKIQAEKIKKLEAMDGELEQLKKDASAAMSDSSGPDRAKVEQLQSQIDKVQQDIEALTNLGVPSPTTADVAGLTGKMTDKFLKAYHKGGLDRLVRSGNF